MRFACEAPMSDVGLMAFLLRFVVRPESGSRSLLSAVTTPTPGALNASELERSDVTWRPQATALGLGLESVSVRTWRFSGLSL